MTPTGRPDCMWPVRYKSSGTGRRRPSELERRVSWHGRQTNGAEGVHLCVRVVARKHERPVPGCWLKCEVRNRTSNDHHRPATARSLSPPRSRHVVKPPAAYPIPIPNPIAMIAAFVGESKNCHWIAVMIASGTSPTSRLLSLGSRCALRPPPPPSAFAREENRP